MRSRTRQLIVPIDPDRPLRWAVLECLYCLARETRLALRPRPWRVFLSHTSDLRSIPRERSFVAAAEAAVIRTGHAVVDMAYFSAQEAPSAEYCKRMVAKSDIYVGIIGVHYGSPVRGRPNLSYTELEYETATSLGLARLVFLISDDAPSMSSVVQPSEHRAQQDAFRARLREADLMTVGIRSPADLELSLMRALYERSSQ